MKEIDIPCIFSVPKLLKQKSQKLKETANSVDFGVLEEYYSSEWASVSPTLRPLRKAEELELSLISGNSTYY
jgi:hypothetical protein